MEYASRHDGVGFEQFAKVAEKNHAHSSLNPLAQYQKVFSLDEVMGAAMVAYPNTLLMCCPTGDGAAAVVLCSDAKLKTLDPDVRRRAVKISASVLTSDPYVESDTAQPDVSTLTKLAAAPAYEQAGRRARQDLDLVELHDCFATAELIHYENLQLCEPGGAGDFIDRRGPWRDGATPVNVSGGLISKGHPIGATGVANLYEVATHLRGEAGDRQIEGATVGLTHVIGLGSACAVHVLETRRLLAAGPPDAGPGGVPEALLAGVAGRRPGRRAGRHDGPDPRRPRRRRDQGRAARRRPAAAGAPARSRRHVAALRGVERGQDLRRGRPARRPPAASSSSPAPTSSSPPRAGPAPWTLDPAARPGRGVGARSPPSAPTGPGPGGRRATSA